MKFEVKLNDWMKRRNVIRALTIAVRVCKRAIMRITRDATYFIINNHIAPNVGYLLCKAPHEAVYDDVTFSGYSDDYPEIYLDLISYNLLRILRLVHKTHQVTMTLQTSSDYSSEEGTQSYLTLDADWMDGEIVKRSVSHRVPVSIVKHQLWDQYMVPGDYILEGSVRFDDIKTLRTLCKRLKNVTPFAELTLNDAGNFKLVSEHDSASAEIEFTAVECDKKPEDKGCVDVRIDLRKMYAFLAGFVSSPDWFRMGFLDRRMLQMSAVQSGIELEFSLPHCWK